MKRLIPKLSLIGILTLAPLTAQATWFASDVSTEPLYRAHEAYLRKDIRSMATELKELFKDPKSDETAQKNGLALLEQAYRLRGGNGIPVDWKLPAEITKMKVTLSYYKRENGDDYALKVSGNTQTQGVIKQLKVTRYPDHVLLDKQANIGEWEDKVDPGDGPYFELDGPRKAKPVEDGLYLLHLELAGGAVTEGWFLVSNMVSTEAPVVHTPSVGESFATRNPVFKFDDFKSTQFQKHENRSLWTAVVKAEPPKFEWIEIWSMWEGSPARTQLNIGNETDAAGVKRLENGRYNFFLSYKEERRFGDLRLGRQSVSITPFHVKAR